MKRKIGAISLLVTLILGGCTNSQTKMLVEQQNAEVLALQETKRAILMREAKTAEEVMRKKVDLKMINDEIEAAQKAQANAQQIQNEKTTNAVKGVLTGVGAVIGTAVTVHELTK